MLAKVLIKRQFKKGQITHILSLLHDLRIEAMKQPGYISGETLIHFANPRKMLVISTWLSVEHWLRWKENPVRRQFEEMLSEQQDGPAEYDEYVLDAPLK
jgi:heme-degrading monooxygenase HmoA